MLTVINTNRMRPLIAPIGLDYVASATQAAGIETQVLDLALADDSGGALRAYFAANEPRLVGITMRNTDDCFWPSAQSFVPAMSGFICELRAVTNAPLVLGGVGFSVFAAQLVRETGVDFGIHGDGEVGLVELARELEGRRRFECVPGLVWRDGDGMWCNPPAWPPRLTLPTRREAIDNRAYFKAGGQGGFETRRGCPRRCLYCADPAAKGGGSRLRDPAEVGEEIEALVRQGVDVLHTCDAEFNIPREQAVAVCQEMIRRGLGERVRWYAYLAVLPFDAELAALMRRAGCVGINFTGDSASAAMLQRYGQPHRAEHIEIAVRLCREHGMAVMVDLLLGGPGETPETLRETIAFMKHVGPDAVGAGPGVRLYPGTRIVEDFRAAGPLERLPGLRRKYDGPVDLLRPTFYISPELGSRPASLVRDLIGNDPRFFPPAEEACGAADGDHNYNDNSVLTDAIAAGARGAYWDILRRTP